MRKIDDILFSQHSYKVALEQATRTCPELNEMADDYADMLQKNEPRIDPDTVTFLTWHIYFLALFDQILVPFTQLFSVVIKHRFINQIKEITSEKTNALPLTIPEAFDFLRKFETLSLKRLFIKWNVDVVLSSEIIESIVSNDVERFTVAFGKVENLDFILRELSLQSFSWSCVELGAEISNYLARIYKDDSTICGSQLDELDFRDILTEFESSLNALKETPYQDNLIEELSHCCISDFNEFVFNKLIPILSKTDASDEIEMSELTALRLEYNLPWDFWKVIANEVLGLCCRFFYIITENRPTHEEISALNLIFDNCQLPSKEIETIRAIKASIDHEVLHNAKLVATDTSSEFIEESKYEFLSETPPLMPDKDETAYFAISSNFTEFQWQWLINGITKLGYIKPEQKQLMFYRMTGKCKPQQIESIHWDGDVRVLIHIVKNCYVNQSGKYITLQKFFSYSSNQQLYLDTNPSQNAERIPIKNIREANYNKLYNSVKKEK